MAHCAISRQRVIPCAVAWREHVTGRTCDGRSLQPSVCGGLPPAAVGRPMQRRSAHTHRPSACCRYVIHCAGWQAHDVPPQRGCSYRGLIEASIKGVEDVLGAVKRTPSVERGGGAGAQSRRGHGGTGRTGRSLITAGSSTQSALAHDSCRLFRPSALNPPLPPHSGPHFLPGCRAGRARRRPHIQRAGLERCCADAARGGARTHVSCAFLFAGA